jgi:hypothetical protein
MVPEPALEPVSHSRGLNRLEVDDRDASLEKDGVNAKFAVRFLPNLAPHRINGPRI